MAGFLQPTPAYWGIVEPARLDPRPADEPAPRILRHDDVAASSTSPRARPTQTGTAVYDCTLSMTDGFGAPVTSVATVTIDVRR